MNIVEILRQPEGKTLEFKRELSSPNPILRSVVAFANTAGGTILIGVEDKTRHVRGVNDPLALEEKVANLICDTISPRLLPDIEILRYRSSHVLAVRVHPSPNRPHHLGSEPENGTYVRVGSTNRRADADLIAELRRYSLRHSFDEGPMLNLDSEALDFRAASESFAEFRKLTERDLDVLGLRTVYQGRKVPTVGGILLYGRERLTHFPDAWVQAGRFMGTDRARIVDQAELRMPLAETIPAALDFVERHLASGVEFDRVHRQPQWKLPPVAVREALVNAVAHADYSQRGAPVRVAVFNDRLEVENPGLLPFGLTLEDLPRGVSKLRNRVIGRVFHEIRLVEHWGSGAQRMIAACREFGLPWPVWEEVGQRLRVTLRTQQVVEPEIDATDQAILGELDANGSQTREIALVIGLSPRATRARLAKLVKRGLAVEIGSGPQDPKRKYFPA
ncbi:MAG: putative DNA binding domain-containing protein [Gammaproteobacteria bacterium]|nr:putative DNA binding domain-containing protein [Gammaproteobacteria bacterium]